MLSTKDRIETAGHPLESAAAVALAKDPLRKFLDDDWTRAVSKAPALTSDQHAALLLDLANKGRLVMPRLYELVGGASLQFEFLANAAACLEKAALEELRSWLAIIARRDAAEMAALRDELRRRWFGKIVALPAEAKDGSDSFRYLALNLPEAIAFATHRFPISDLGTRLCRCRYRKCLRFFLVDRHEVLANRKNPQGRIRRDYCCAEHRRQEQKQSNRERQQRIRDKRKAALEATKTRRHK